MNTKISLSTCPCVTSITFRCFENAINLLHHLGILSHTSVIQGQLQVVLTDDLVRMMYVVAKTVHNVLPMAPKSVWPNLVHHVPFIRAQHAGSPDAKFVQKAIRDTFIREHHFDFTDLETRLHFLHHFQYPSIRVIGFRETSALGKDDHLLVVVETNWADVWPSIFILLPSLSVKAHQSPTFPCILSHFWRHYDHSSRSPRFVLAHPKIKSLDSCLDFIQIFESLKRNPPTGQSLAQQFIVIC